MKKKVFTVEYLKDFNCGRAAIVAGFDPGDAEELLADPEVARAITQALDDRMEIANIDAGWLLQQLVENHYIARQEGKLSASNAALKSIGQHAKVDAFAAEKIELSTDRELAERLQRARKEY